MPTKEYLRPKQIEETFGMKAVTARYYFSRGILKGAKILGTVYINAADLRSRMQRVEAGEPSEIVFSVPESSNLVVASKYKKEVAT